MKTRDLSRLVPLSILSWSSPWHFGGKKVLVEWMNIVTKLWSKISGLGRGREIGNFQESVKLLIPWDPSSLQSESEHSPQSLDTFPFLLVCVAFVGLTYLPSSYDGFEMNLCPCWGFIYLKAKAVVTHLFPTIATSTCLAPSRVKTFWMRGWRENFAGGGTR